MNIIKLNLEHYDKWDQFCFDNKWFFHTTYWMQYVQNSKFRVRYKNHSFFTEQDGKIIDVVPLIQENDKLISPGFSENKKILQEINKIALENDIKSIHVNSNIKSYLNTSGYTCVLDLDNMKPSKGHKSAIKKGEKYLKYDIVYEIDEFKKDYFEIAGKVTRPEKTFELLEEWIKLGFGILLKAKFEGKIAGYIYVIYYNNYAYYFMSATFPEFKEYNVSHYLQSIAFNILRKKGIMRYELGEQVYNNLNTQSTEKELNISKFKRSFGGNIILNPRSEYFFDKEEFERIYLERIKNYARSEYE